MNQTLTYYNQNARSFISNTRSVDFSENQTRFTKKLSKAAKILDFGCGSGRDARYFTEQGFCVTAVDGSKELCERACEYAGIPVKQMLFQELSEIEEYDAIWACASILHLSSEELPEMLRKMRDALKPGGMIYMSFKYGTFEGERNGRYFTDMTEETLDRLLGKIMGLVIEEQWVTSDVRPERGKEKWMNAIVRKK